MAHRTGKTGLLLGMVLAAGCTTTGSGVGATPSGKHPATFSWTSSDDVSGLMTARFADGKTYTGQFVQVTSNTTVESLHPLWVGWGPRWRMGGWGDWDAGPEFVTHYSGRVVANLAATDGSHMRCRFQLAHPDAGMAGGGTGECQLPDGGRIDAQFPHS